LTLDPIGYVGRERGRERVGRESIDAEREREGERESDNACTPDVQ